MIKRAVSAIGICAAMVFSAVYGLAPLFLPAVQPADAPAGQFSAGRALETLKVIAQAAHPAGSAEMARVAAFIRDSLAQDRLAPQVQDTASTTPAGSVALHNVFVEIPGQAATGAILILAHPDSTPNGPGAGDDGSGAAVLLETARALKAGPALKNDLILLFDDGEELGYLGGYAFAREYPALSKVRLAIGLDTAAWGPAVLLQTTPENGMLIQGYARSVRSPLAFGFFAQADWTISQDTSEIQPFVEKGISGLAIEDPTAFAGKHTSEDTLAQVNPASMQQMGDQVLALAREYGNMDFSQAQPPAQSYFTLWGIGVVHYPQWVDAVLLGIALVGFAGVVFTGIRRKRLDGKGLGLGGLFSLAVLALCFALGLAGSKLFETWFPNPNPHADSYLAPASLPFLIAALLLAAGIGFGGRRLARRWLKNKSAAAAGWVPWLVLGVLAALFLPAGGYLFILPALAGLAAWAWMVLAEEGKTPAAIVLAAPAFIATVLMVPNLALAFLGAGMTVLPLVTLLFGMVVDLWLSVFKLS